MSANDDEEVPGREIAYRLFAAEYDDASLSYAESDEERAPNYVISPTGARLNRVFAVGTLTEVTSVNEEMVRARVVDPTGAFVVYAGQYQPDELAFLEGVEPPEFVAVTGKARTFQPEDGDQVYTSLRPESIATVDADTRDRWVVSAAEQTLERIGTYAGAAGAEPRSADSRAAEARDADGEDLTDALLEAGVEPGLAAGIPLAQDHYGTTPAYLAALRECALEACEVVAGERDQVSGLDLAPDATSPEYDVSFESLADLDGIDADALESEPAEPMAATAGGSGAATDPDDAHSGSAAGTATETEPGTAAAAIDPEPDETTADPDPAADADSAAEGVAVSADDEPAEAETDAEAVGDAESDTNSLEAGDDATDRESEAETTPATTDGASADDGDDLGDFDAGEMDDGGMYEMDDEEREQLEEEFGAEFTTGSQVEEPGEAEIDVPEPDEPTDDPADAPEPDDADAESATAEAGDSDADDGLGAPPESGLEADDASDASETDAEPEAAVTADESTDEAAAETDDTESDAEPADDVDLEDYVVETMEELDDGDGADRTELVEAVADDTGAAPEDVEEAIQDALMGGQCYEPDDETLKAI
ncbi:hypothetical protein C488_02321 [Natrinema pellirubrum DSM 15624]|uniref:Rpa-associated protein n=1 Tax=Natrinema pellirubrum (strain DSM 15624 / CIP 106293 / JCM 10476 / NCIMB 786 / 157) TaxID=797303 RepID=L0JKZ6_NATP1|nr:hypothetical protein [Natrinema pellirubrum]AGB31031.1 hypothetical protein Natpe_1119 [Natrinema pellirubrum DSM 15624]ELY81124.1 hypothetical protein C488_02321 [Natrinema pellirubrum DSM 15624]